MPSSKLVVLCLHDLLAIAYFLDLTIICLLFAIVEDGELGIAARVCRAINVGTRMSSAEALAFIRIVVEHGCFLFITMMAWALLLSDELAHVVRLGTTTAFQLPLLVVGIGKVGQPTLAMVSLAIVVPARMSRAVARVSGLVIVQDWELCIIACLVLA